MSEENTLITDIKKGRAYFLGAELRSHVSRTFDAMERKRKDKGGAKRVRESTGKAIILAPIEKIVKKLEEQGVCRVVNFRRRVIIPQRKTA